MSKKQTVAVTVKNPALAAALHVKPGSKVDVETRGGVPTSRYWRNRFRDAKIDESLELPKPQAEKSKKADAPTGSGSSQES